jgi:hypothetical protein
MIFKNKKKKLFCLDENYIDNIYKIDLQTQAISRLSLELGNKFGFSGVLFAIRLTGIISNGSSYPLNFYIIQTKLELKNYFLSQTIAYSKRRLLRITSHGLGKPSKKEIIVFT